VPHDGAEAIGLDAPHGVIIMLPALMRRRLALFSLPVLAAGIVACGSERIDLSKSDPNYEGAQIFAERCSGCHTLKKAGTQGSAVKPQTREYKDGPNFDQRKEEKDQILYAIRNGGFSGAIMPQNIVVGADAEKVAAFVAKYAGEDVVNPPAPQATTTTAAP
jgi:mono/diheme cytochrome c family protein